MAEAVNIRDPRVNGVPLSGNKTGAQLGLVDRTYADTYLAQKNGVYPDLYSGGIASWRKETYTDEHSVTGIANKTEEGRTNITAIAQAANEPMTDVQAIIVTGANVMNSAHKIEGTPFVAFPVPKLTYGEWQNNGVLFNNGYGEDAEIDIVLFSAQYPTEKNQENWIELREVNDATEGNTNGGYYRNDKRRHYLTPSTGWLIVESYVMEKICAILGTWNKPNIYEPTLDWHKGKFYVDFESARKYITKMLYGVYDADIDSMVFLSANSAGTAKNTVTLHEKYMSVDVKCGIVRDYKPDKEWYSEEMGGDDWLHWMRIPFAKANGSARLSDGTVLNVNNKGEVSYTDQNKYPTDLPVVYELTESVVVKIPYGESSVFSESFDATYADDGNSLIALVDGKTGLAIIIQKTNTLEEEIVNVVNEKVPALEAGKADTKGVYKDLVAGDLTTISDRVETKGKFIVRSTAGDESIDISADALLLQLLGGCGETEPGAFKIHSMMWHGANQLDPTALASGKTRGYITGEVVQGTIANGRHKLCIIHTPKCEAGEYGTADKNNGYLLTNSEGENLKVGDGTIVGVWYSATLPAEGTDVTAVTEHSFTGHAEKFYLPSEGYMIVEVAGNANLSEICAHLAWSKDYNRFTPYESPKELVVAVSALTSNFDTETVNGKTCLVLRGIESGGIAIYDNVVIYAGGGGTYERNIKSQLLTGLTWTETEIEGEVVEGEGQPTSGYRYMAPLPTTGTYAAMRDGLIRPDIEGMILDGYNLVYDSDVHIVPSTAFAGKYVDYQIATPVSGRHSIDPTGKKPDDMGTEEVMGGGEPTGTIVISYMRGFRDTMRALYNDFKTASAELDEVKLTKPMYCVGEWLENANTASPNDLDNPNARAVFGNKAWALDWRPFLIDMTAVEGETKKRPVMELKKTNWLRDIYGNWAPVVGITTAMRDECMANALYTDAACTEQYCAAGAFDPEAFLALCSIETAGGVKRLSHPTLYKAADTEVGHYLMPWETVETKYSIFIGRKDEVYLLDNVIGASGKEWNGVIASNVNFWDGVDVKVFALKPTGICPSPATAISENSTTKIRSFFYNYPSALTGVQGRKGYASTCEMFYGDGHYPTSGYSQINTKTNARANNHVATAPFPVAEGGFHARNTFLRCVETALGTKNLCSYARFSSGISSNDSCTNESQWLERGGVRIKASGDSSWTYKNWGQSGKIYYKDGATYKTVDMAGMLTSYGPHVKTLETQAALSFAVEFGIGAGEKFEFNGCT